MTDKKWSVFVYAIVLSFLAVIFGYVITIKMDTLIENLDIQSYTTKLHSNITSKAELAIDYDIFSNGNGSGFTDTILCPDTVTMSGTLSGGTAEIITTAPYLYNTTFVCSGSTMVGNLILSYSSWWNIFTTWSYLWSTISLDPTNGIGLRSGTFTDGSGTFLSFTATGIFSGLDLNKNSDNFLTSSTGTIWYPDDQWDDDDIARRTHYGYVNKGVGWYNAFGMNTSIRTYIEKNPFNTGSRTITAANTQTGYLRVDIDNPYSIKVVEFDKSRFDNIKEFQVISSNSIYSNSGGIGWLMPDLKLSGTKTGAKVFDLKNKDYALFLSFSGNLTNTWVDFLKYKITMENEHGSGVYIVPINDSVSGTVKYLGSDIIIDRDGDYRYKEFEVVR